MGDDGADKNDAYLSDFASPDAKVVSAAKRGLEQYRDSRQYKNEWELLVDEKKGTIETNWYPEHKGELKFKVKIAVWGSAFRVDVFQKIGWLSPSVEKTESSRRIERVIQDIIQAKIAKDRKSEE